MKDPRHDGDCVNVESEWLVFQYALLRHKLENCRKNFYRMSCFSIFFV